MLEINRGGHFPDCRNLPSLTVMEAQEGQTMRSSRIFYLLVQKFGVPRPEKLHSV
jgi:hypothetical protein